MQLIMRSWEVIVFSKYYLLKNVNDFEIRFDRNFEETLELMFWNQNFKGLSDNQSFCPFPNCLAYKKPVKPNEH